jgi:hypothetical protein
MKTRIKKDGTKNQRKADLVKKWDSLLPKSQDQLRNIADVLALGEKIGEKKGGTNDLEDYRIKLAKVKELMSRLEFVSLKTMDALLAYIPDKKVRTIFSYFETLRYLYYAAEFNPLFFYEEDRKAFILAERLIQDVSRKLPALVKAKE